MFLKNRALRSWIRPFFLVYWVCLASLLFVGCATTRPLAERYSPKQLYDFACRPGMSLTSVQGSAWLKLTSPEISGQFPANVLVNSPDQLELEVTNFLGGTEAIISVTQHQYEITQGQRGNSKQKVKADLWGGIPLKWATELFLGRIPCPPLGPQVRLSIDSQNRLEVTYEDSAKKTVENYRYEFKNVQGGPWPERLQWNRSREVMAAKDVTGIQLGKKPPQKIPGTRGPSPISIDFEFSDPENETFSPKKWEARSQSGSVRVRWRERTVEKSRY